MARVELDGEAVVVTGAASGIGAAVVDALLARGARVAATDLRLAALEATAAARGWPAERVRLLVQDVADAARWEAVLDEVEEALGPVAVLVNNAGVIRPAWLLETTAEDVALHLDTNARGTVLGTRAAALRMVPRGRGHIVNVSSLCGIAATPGMGLYAASKFAIRGYSLSAAAELRPRGVAVTVVCPDGVDTPMARMELHHPAAALTFSSGGLLRAEDVAAQIVGPVLARRPLEHNLPWWRGALCHLSGLLPWLGTAGMGVLLPYGERVRKRLLAELGG